MCSVYISLRGHNQGLHGKIIIKIITRQVTPRLMFTLNIPTLITRTAKKRPITMAIRIAHS